ncbi:MAG: glycosyltransferase family 9 protein [Ignavibacteria bacterium]|nr:glycosyltransferase family 9 protein [Ignavibacteria bacterium]
MGKIIDKNNVKNILITRTDRLGDVILTLPLLNSAKKIFKNAKIDLLVKKYLEELLHDYKDIDELIIEENINSFFSKYKFFKNKKIDLFINVKPGFELALLFFVLRVKYRIGTAYRWYSFLYNFKVYEHRKDSVKHESDYNLNLLKNFFKETDDSKVFHFGYSEDEKKKLNKKLNGLPDSRYIIVHPGSGGSAKDIPVKRLALFINKFSEIYADYRIVITGTDNEKPVINQLMKNIRSDFKTSVHDVSGMLDLKELMILIDNSDVFISNSTGPVHIAGALNRNIIGFYPNEKPMSDTRWKPLSENTVILKPGGLSDDMDLITEDIIMKAVTSFLK